MVTAFIESLYNEQVSPPDQSAKCSLEDSAWSEIEQTSLHAQIYHLLNFSGMSEAVLVDWRGLLKQRVQSVLAQNMIIRREQNQILARLDGMQIAAIPLKGVSFAERFFGHIGARPTSDIDLLIHRADLSRVVPVLTSAGFSGPYDFNPIHYHCIMSKRVPFQAIPLNVELHWSLVTECTAHLDMTSFWADSVLKDQFQHIRELSTHHTFYAMCLHGANHKMESLKFSIDLAQLVFRFGGDIDYEILLDQAKSDGTSRRIRSVLTVLYQQFPSLHRVKPLPFRPHHKDAKRVLSSPVLSLDTWKFRFKFIKEWVLPNPGSARWHTGGSRQQPIWGVYLRFYRNRITKFVQSRVKRGAERTDEDATTPSSKDGGDNQTRLKSGSVDIDGHAAHPSIAEQVSIIHAVLDKRGYIEIPSVGHSMFPAILQGDMCRFEAVHPGHDPIGAARCTEADSVGLEIARGDIILFVSRRGNLTAHRFSHTIHEHETSYYIMKGDANRFSDGPVPEGYILGKLKSVKRGGRVIISGAWPVGRWGGLTTLSIPLVPFGIRLALRCKYLLVRLSKFGFRRCSNERFADAHKD